MVVKALDDSIPTKNLGEVKFFLGCEFICDREAGTIEISQESYIRSVLERFNICRTSSTPDSLANDNRSLKEDEGAGNVPFREVVGSLMWIASQTRPECCADCGEALSRAKENPLGGSPEDPELSSRSGASNSEVQAGQFGRRRHVGGRRCRLCEQGH